MVHICGIGHGEGEDWTPECPEWKDGDRTVCIESAMDPQLLQVDCPHCLAVASKELREG